MSFPFVPLVHQHSNFSISAWFWHWFTDFLLWAFGCFLVLFLMTQVECSLKTSSSCTRMFFNALTSCQCQHLHLFFIFFFLKTKKKIPKRDTDLWTSFLVQAQFHAVMNLTQQWKYLKSLFNPEICSGYLDPGLQKCWAGKEHFTHSSGTQQTVSTSPSRYLSGHLSAVKLLLCLVSPHTPQKMGRFVTGDSGHNWSPHWTCTPDFCVTKWNLEM